MNKFSKKTAFGITVAASAALVVGFAAPAMASTSHNTPLGGGSTHSSTSSSSRVTQAQLDALRTVTTGVTGGNVSAWTPLVVSPEIGVGDVASGNAVGSGNDIPLLSGNTVSAPVASGDETGIANNDANGSANGNATANGDSISSSVKDLVNNATKDLGLGNITGNSATATPTTGASGSLGDVTGDLGLGNLLGSR